MSTQRTIDLGLHLLRKSGYGTFHVGREHHRLCGYNRTFTGTVATWLTQMPTAELSRLIDTLAECAERADPGTFYEAERLLAVLTILLPDFHQDTAEIATYPTCSTGYALRLDALTADLALRAARAMDRRYTDALGPAKLLDASQQAQLLLHSPTLQLPPPNRDPITDPIVRALHAAATRLIAEHDETTALASLVRSLADAVKAGQW